MLAVAAACLTAGAACADPVKIAVVETLSGPQAASGLMYRAAGPPASLADHVPQSPELRTIFTS